MGMEETISVLLEMTGQSLPVSLLPGKNSPLSTEWEAVE
jgi:hypothetical protein